MEKQEVIKEILKLSHAICKPLIWLDPSDSVDALKCEIERYIRDAMHLILKYPKSVPAFCDKIRVNYQRAIDNNWIGVGQQPVSTRRGARTRKYGVEYAQKYAEKQRLSFFHEIELVRNECPSEGNQKSWDMLFVLVRKFIDYLDWDDHIRNNQLGQCANLVVEATELLFTAEKDNNDSQIQEEIGDVFFNLIAVCISLGIQHRSLSGHDVRM